MVESSKQDEKATFTIQIQFKQHSTWQGTITWIEGEKTQNFRSELELIKLMMEASPFDENDEKAGLCTWG